MERPAPRHTGPKGLGGDLRYARRAMALRKASIALGVTAGAALAAACGGRVDASTVAACGAPAIAYCESNGCPLTGPASASVADAEAWCRAAPAAFASRVRGFGTCSTSNGAIWAEAVEASDATGGALWVLYDPTTGQLVNVSTLDPSATDGGTSETDYGSCAQHSGIVSCNLAVGSSGCGP